MSSKKHLFLFGIVLVVLVSGCAQTVPIDDCITNPPHGFWSGLWHGMIAPFSFIVSLFNDSLKMYSVNNNGAWYDFGFVLGAGILSLGSSK